MQAVLIPPLRFKHFNGIEQHRIVLYREDYRAIITLDPKDGRLKKAICYVVEISRSKYKLFIVAIRIPNS
jgi:hypothetical protein